MGALILIVAGVFLLCYLADKGFTKLFRGKVQHQSGKSVRLSKRYGSIGAILFAFGVAAVFMGLNNGEWVLAGGAALLVLGGIALVIAYLSFGIYYDEDSLILSKFGKPSVTYYFKNIRSQQIYLASGNVVIELHMNDGSHFQVHTGMVGMYPFMDHAFRVWLQQTGRRQEDCTWYDPDNSCWFPPYEA
jgi:hypothetical protein